MKIASETFTVLPHPADGEISLLIAGLKIVLGRDEARALIAQLLSAAKAISGGERLGGRGPRPAAKPVREPAAEIGAAPEPCKPEPSESLPAKDSRVAHEPPLVLTVPAGPPGATSTPVEAGAGKERKPGAKLRSFLKALVKDDDAISGGEPRRT